MAWLIDVYQISTQQNLIIQILIKIICIDVICDFQTVINYVYLLPTI